MDVDGGGNKRVFQRLGGSSTDPKNKVCYHWRAGKCNRYPCPFLHRELPSPPIQPPNGTASSKRHHVFNAAAADDPTVPRRAPNNTWGRPHAGRGGGGANNRVVRKMDKVCSYWLQGNCSRGETCKFLHSWSLGDGFSLLSQLDGHQKVVSAIAMPAGSDKLYTGSKDETLRVWDCQSGQCIGVLNLGGEVGCMISEGPWIFVGLPSIVKAWNTQTNMDLSLSGPVGQVYALIVGNDLLFAGTQDGSILAWKFNAAVNCFEPAASLKGHTLAVVSLVVGANRLYSGSMDHSIRVWNLETLQCIQTLTEHTNVVMSVLIWDHYLLSCSLDKTIKAWVTGQSGNLEVAYTHTEEHGLLTLGGMYDSESKPLLLCSTNDNSVRIYDLPSFAERGKIFSKMEIRAIQIGPGGIFFTGDGTGQVKVWKLAAVEAANPA
ncbi:hypothetical protein FEM48_Zijuj03G0148900 [Ziziphus jujuba var. spinosa]|uniref:C3H1-type domain-containing protein n=1 Tax=Ziziphus jujuba var. spinosa TaxID=714518 RepID=A0A978VQY9_ZIZJJ|nr:hypothetical protein FEM48_Zijuj03G0148900 [Ziziphus jujuba var. spinosa]